MVAQAEQDRVKHLLSEALPMLCKSGLSFSSEFCIEALIGITLDKNDVFLVSIKETIESESSSGDSHEKTTDISITRVDTDLSQHSLSPHNNRKRKHSRKTRNSESESDNEATEVQIKREKMSMDQEEDDTENLFETISPIQRQSYSACDTQSTGPILVKQEPSMILDQSTETFNLTDFSSSQNESVDATSLAMKQTMVLPMQTLTHEEAAAGIGRGAGMSPSMASDDTGQSTDAATNASATSTMANPRNFLGSFLTLDFPVS